MRAQRRASVKLAGCTGFACNTSEAHLSPLQLIDSRLSLISEFGEEKFCAGGVGGGGEFHRA